MDKRPKAKLTVSMGGYSTAGNREVNQDAFALKDPYSDSEKRIKGIVACVADGVSCSDNGQQASHTSVTQFIADYYSTNNSWDVKQSASKVLNSLNTWLYQHNQNDLRHNGLITTFSSVIFKSTTAHLIHIGDSRIYRYREQALTQLSHDHSRRTHAKNSVLTRALGMDCHLDIDYQAVSLQVDDLFMLSSDGVHDYLEKEVIAANLSRLSEGATTKDYEQVAKDICDQALAQGSSDNISCLIVKITTLPNADLSELFTHLSTLVIPPALQVGNEIDCFRIDKVLHEGARSHVYLATDKSNQNKVVLKMPSLNFEEDLNYLLGFYKEQWVGQSIDNPSIMSIANNIKNSVFLYHICEYVEGVSLRQWMLDNPHPELQQVNTIINKVVNAVRVLQRAGMVHRDLKPENIMLTSDGNIKILDFGTVRVNGFEEIVKEQQEEPLGAVDYIAPEYLNNGESSALSDLFSIAVIAYEMLSGQLPYPSNQAQSLDRARQYTWEYVSIQPLRPEISSRLDKVLQKALNPKPNQRYSSMSEFIGDLTKVQQRQIAKAPKKSLLERDPVKFWQWLAFIFMGISASQLFIMLRDNF
ncbi:bifunctional protein-serine/threonine kinase/phosphatase [Psychromonas sp. B3M02]|uniref:bifunctional protein-serine/threonine kinase/phosphatase n=1 Tax=Psychromonas sp. B3M02 TaxID=2267226 RepID=UPI000DEACA93|nr:bifunctional protein-serine/threonine kinase/phosphatase [Psychromonas sp. B3M02]RBW46980.1 bifunctional protein-serine/threonine kinase/phosphatase [Psychromonas sp. B3M02]